MLKNRLVQHYYLTIFVILHLRYLQLLVQNDRLTYLPHSYVFSWGEKVRTVFLDPKSTAVVGLARVYLIWYSGLVLKTSPMMLAVYLYQTSMLFLNVFAVST